MRVVVTGAAGFIGSHVADRLLGEGHSVWAVDNLDPYYDPEQKLRNIAGARRSERHHFASVDIRDADALAAVFDEAAPDCVIHLAARAGVRASVDSPLEYIQVNELGGCHVLEQCRCRGRLPLVFASTSSVYGLTTQIPFREDDPACGPLSPYAATKRASELMAHSFWHIHRQPAAVLRFFTVYGPRGRPDMAFAKFSKALLTGDTITLHGPDTERDFTYVDDIVDGVLGALTWVTEKRELGTFNVGGCHPVNVSKIIDLLAAGLGAKPEISMGRLQPGESLRTWADVSAAERAFSYQPKVSLEEGTRRWIEWLRSDEAPPEVRALVRKRASSV